MIQAPPVTYQTAAYRYPIGTDIAFATTNGVKRGRVASVTISIDTNERFDGAIKTSVLYAIKVQNAKPAAPTPKGYGSRRDAAPTRVEHVEHVNELLCALTLDDAWVLYGRITEADVTDHND